MQATTETSSQSLSKLTVIGVGAFTEMFDHVELWRNLNQNQNKSVLPSDANAFVSTRHGRLFDLNRRGGKSLKAAIEAFVQHWAIPGVSIWPELRTGDGGDVSYFSERIGELVAIAGLASHKVDSVGVFGRNDPEEVLERAFQFMDGHLEVPAILLFASDGDITRSLTGDASRQPFWQDGPRRFGSLCETVVALLLARPERVDHLRPFATNLDAASNQARPIPSGFKSSKYLPTPWTVDQLKQFYATAPIAELHRPVRVSYRTDKEGKQTFDLATQTGTMRAREKEAAVKAGLAMTIDGLDINSITRIFYDTGALENGSHVVPLSVALGDVLPDLDMFSSEQGFDIHNRIGNTGAASPLLQWALAALATSQNKDISLTANLRQKDEITITAITPSKTMHRAPAPITQNSAALPIAAASLPKLAIPHVALGARLQSGAECTQTGMWRCEPPDAEAGATHFIMAGRKLPPIRVMRDLSMWQKARGESVHDLVSATYTLVSYETPHA